MSKTYRLSAIDTPSPSRGARGLLVIVVLAAALAWGAPSARAAAYEPPPVPALSYYIGTTSTTVANDEGCEQGHDNLEDFEKSAVILDFGGQLKDGGAKSVIVKKLKFTSSEIAAYAEAFATGYLECYELDEADTPAVAKAPEQSLSLAIGTNNDLDEVSEAGGKAWAGDVATVAGHVLEDSVESEQITIWGGSDLEDEYSTGSKALKWAKGYSAATDSPYVDYGDAGGCPPTSHENGPCLLEKGGKAGWNQKVEYELSWGINHANPTPEIYVPEMAEEWAQIDLYGGGGMYFLGPLDENFHDESGGSNDPNEAWEQLIKQLAEYGLKTYLPYSLAI